MHPANPEHRGVNMIKYYFVSKTYVDIIAAGMAHQLRLLRRVGRRNPEYLSEN